MGPPLKLLVGVLLASLVSIIVAAEAPAPAIVTAQPEVSCGPIFPLLGSSAFTHPICINSVGLCLLVEAISVPPGSHQGYLIRLTNIEHRAAVSVYTTRRKVGGGPETQEGSWEIGRPCLVPHVSDLLELL
jgi:hypothetical protein